MTEFVCVSMCVSMCVCVCVCVCVYTQVDRAHLKGHREAQAAIARIAAQQERGIQADVELEVVNMLRGEFASHLYSYVLTARAQQAKKRAW